mgnify:CR=1 FL=1
MKPIKNRKEFFDSLEAGLQSYFDAYDSEWGGILHLTIGVRCGEVGGIIKSADAPARRPSMEGLAESTEVEMQAVVVEPLPEKKAKRNTNKKSKKQ